jgi:hypothetical protein
LDRTDELVLGSSQVPSGCRPAGINHPLGEAMLAVEVLEPGGALTCLCRER